MARGHIWPYLTLVSYPDPSRKNREGDWQHIAHCCVKEFNQLLKQVLMFTHLVEQYPFYAWCVAMRHYLMSGEYWRWGTISWVESTGDEALPCEWRILNSTNSQLWWKVVVAEAPPVASIWVQRRKLLLPFLASPNFAIHSPSNVKPCQDATALSACSWLMWCIWILQPNWRTPYSAHGHGNVLHVARPWPRPF